MNRARGAAPAQLEGAHPSPAYTRKRAGRPCPRQWERLQSQSACPAACSVSAAPSPEKGRSRRLPGSSCHRPSPSPPRRAPEWTARQSRDSNHAIVIRAARSSSLGVAASMA